MPVIVTTVEEMTAPVEDPMFLRTSRAGEEDRQRST
jgi:hypothetical protein